MAAHPNHLVNIVRLKLTCLVFCDASGIEMGGVWFDTSRYGTSIMWHQPWPSDIIVDLVSETDPGEALTNYNFYISALVLHKANILAEFLEANMSAPCSVLDNTPNVSCSMRDLSTVNLEVAGHLRIHALH